MAAWLIWMKPVAPNKNKNSGRATTTKFETLKKNKRFKYLNSKRAFPLIHKINSLSIFPSQSQIDQLKRDPLQATTATQVPID
ncbi:hypothetical protein GQ600_6033 [Phytophthora cactorum]|nr:hypothetical protein GQ600_6033 [Phytophthora cactorum]